MHKKYLHLVLTVSTYIVLNTLHYLMLCIDSVNIDGMVEKPSVSAFENFLWIENQLNIKKVMGRNLWMCFVLTAST